MTSWLITLYGNRALLAKAKTIVPKPNLVTYQAIVVIMVVRLKSTSVQERVILWRDAGLLLHIERWALKIGKNCVSSRFFRLVLSS
jgi:hypothetical protein